MDEVKACFSKLWDKAAYQCQLLKNEIERQFPFLTVMGGKGAFDSEHHTENSESGEPDLFLYYGQRLICAVEVTGSDKVANPWKIWIGAHKIKFAETAKYPLGFFFFYGKDNQMRYFTTYDEIKTVVEPVKIRTIRGLNFEYHILDNSYFKDEAAFWNWLQYCIENFQETEP